VLKRAAYVITGFNKSVGKSSVCDYLKRAAYVITTGFNKSVEKVRVCLLQDKPAGTAVWRAGWLAMKCLEVEFSAKRNATLYTPLLGRPVTTGRVCMVALRWQSLWHTKEVCGFKLPSYMVRALGTSWDKGVRRILLVTLWPGPLAVGFA
jgi:hypothetical protein